MSSDAVACSSLAIEKSPGLIGDARPPAFFQWIYGDLHLEFQISNVVSNLVTCVMNLQALKSY